MPVNVENICRLCFVEEDIENGVGLVNFKKFIPVLEYFSGISTGNPTSHKICSNCLSLIESTQLLRSRVKSSELFWDQYRKTHAPPPPPTPEVLFNCHMCIESHPLNRLAEHITNEHGAMHLSSCGFCKTLLELHSEPEAFNTENSQQSEMVFEKSFPEESEDEWNTQTISRYDSEYDPYEENPSKRQKISHEEEIEEYTENTEEVEEEEVPGRMSRYQVSVRTLAPELGDKDDPNDRYESEQRFRKALADWTSKNKATSLISKEKYDERISTYLSARKKIKGKTTLDFFVLRRYALVETTNGYRLAAAPKKGEVVDESNAQYFLHNDEIFDVLYEAHLSVEHGRRDKTMAAIKGKFCNLSRPAIQTFLNSCVFCEKIGKLSRKPEEEEIPHENEIFE